MSTWKVARTIVAYPNFEIQHSSGSFRISAQITPRHSLLRSDQSVLTETKQPNTSASSFAISDGSRPAED